METQNSPDCNIGTEIYRYRGVPVYENGKYKDVSHGQSFSADNQYYYGQKWQCVEFVKRFYDLVLNHRMPHVWGHAKDFFDWTVGHGELNARRGLIQFKNCGDMPPKIHDILVFSDTLYGHLAIVSHVSKNTVEAVQQNIAEKSVETFSLTYAKASFCVHTPRTPDGWLRIPRSRR